LEEQITTRVWNPIELKMWFYLHSCIPKDPKWATHIADMTRVRR
jgi:hypothetical protein